EALRRYPRIFSDLYVSMVRAGEASGDLDGVLSQLADYLEAMEELKRRIKSAMTYPVVALTMIIAIAGGLIVFVVPQFAEIFNSFDPELPDPTRLTITISDGLKNIYTIDIGLVVVTGGIVLYRMSRASESGRFRIDQIKLRLPVFGKLLR